MTLRSHTEKEILVACMHGETICALNSGIHGADDILIGSLEDCRQDVTDNEGENIFETQGWTLSELSDSDELLKSIVDDAETDFIIDIDELSAYELGLWHKRTNAKNISHEWVKARGMHGSEELYMFQNARAARAAALIVAEIVGEWDVFLFLRSRAAVFVSVNPWGCKN